MTTGQKTRTLYVRLSLLEPCKSIICQSKGALQANIVCECASRDTATCACYRLRSSASAGAKLFYLSGIRNGKYLQREILNLARFISVMKFRPLSWRLTHPYLLTDRFEVRLSQPFKLAHVTACAHVFVSFTDAKCVEAVSWTGSLQR